MLLPDDFDNAIRDSRERLISMSESLARMRCPPMETRRFNLRDLTPDYIDNVLEGVPGQTNARNNVDHIYVLRLPEGQGGISATLASQLESARGNGTAFCRINSEHLSSETLYVGRSKNLKARLQQHLGARSLSVFSIHFECWAKQNDVDVSIGFMRFTDADDALVQAIEDALWASLKPAFGRSGKR